MALTGAFTVPDKAEGEMAGFYGAEVDYLIDPKPLTLADLRSAS